MIFRSTLVFWMSSCVFIAAIFFGTLCTRLNVYQYLFSFVPIIYHLDIVVTGRKRCSMEVFYSSFKISFTIFCFPLKKVTLVQFSVLPIISPISAKDKLLTNLRYMTSRIGSFMLCINCKISFCSHWTFTSFSSAISWIWSFVDKISWRFLKSFNQTFFAIPHNQVNMELFPLNRSMHWTAWKKVSWVVLLQYLHYSSCSIKTKRLFLNTSRIFLRSLVLSTSFCQLVPNSFILLQLS